MDAAPFARDAITTARRAALDPDRARATVLGRQSTRTPEEEVELEQLRVRLASAKAARIAASKAPLNDPEAPRESAPSPERRRKR